MSAYCRDNVTHSLDDGRFGPNACIGQTEPDTRHMTGKCSPSDFAKCNGGWKALPVQWMILVIFVVVTLLLL